MVVGVWSWLDGSLFVDFAFLLLNESSRIINTENVLF